MKIDRALFSKKVSIEDIGLYSKSAIAFLFMFVIPLLLMCYLIFLAPRIITDRSELLIHDRTVIIWITVSGLFGYLFLRRTLKALISIIKQAKRLSLGVIGDAIEVDRNDELKDLALSFNRINASLEAKIKELEYSQRLTRELFQQIGHAITSSQKIGALFSIIVHGTRKVLDMASVSVALYDSVGDLYLKAFSGTQKGIRENIRLPDDKGAVGQAIRNDCPIVADINDAQLRSRIGKDAISYEKNIVCVPISAKGKVKGVLCATDKMGAQSAGKEDVSLLENVAGQIAICVENIELSSDIEETYYNTLVMLARIVEAKDPYSAGHLERVSAYVVMIADKLDIEKEIKKILIGGALLHDLGKVGIEDAILKKKGQLTPQEYEIAKQHSIIGENILKPLQSMSKLSELVRHHHERYDGTGYPDGLKGDQIPLSSRILAIADIYDALTTDRSYRKAMSHKEAMDLLNSYAGNKLDPKLVEVFVELMAEKENAKTKNKFIT